MDRLKMRDMKQRHSQNAHVEIARNGNCGRLYDVAGGENAGTDLYGQPKEHIVRL